MIEKLLNFLREVKVELGRVTYPSKQEIIGSTIMVFVFSIALTIFIGVVDLLISRIVIVFLR